MVRILRLVMTILFSYSSYPLRAAALVGFAHLRAQPAARRVLPAPGLFGDTHVQGWTTRSCCCRSSTASRSRCSRCSASTSSARSTRSAPSDSYHVTARVPEVTSAPAGHRRPALRHDVPARPARGAPADRDGPPGAARAEGVPVRGARRPRAGVVRAAPTSATPPTRPCSARRAPATSSTPRPPTAPPPCSGDPLILVQLRDPVERAVSHWAFSTDAGLETRPLAEVLERQPRRAAAVGPRADLGLAVRLPRARPLRRLPAPVAGAGSATT